ncbi:polysaccharide biosynthesis C-terminal domain-containing protein [Chitinophaga agri]|uniref:SDR family oxidoreductase n=1 Tax=Chitinophaga agri TaxID=2703787 RepID=A0A6B9ZCC2_9BACT|nr:NAD-dependent epimerase/dehydratase family protein [Chitinophaga agri]QHS58243.1 SDR family oxidoreductase [Chitinophaga agri]
MKKVGISGQQGFVGSYLYNRLSLLKDDYQLVPFERAFFDHEDQLSAWAGQCDVIVHLAGMNRHDDQQVIHDTNISLTERLISAIKKAGNSPHLLFSSSTQEERDNLYGRSKKAARNILKEWADAHNARFTGLVIPNVFGPFGKPFYNSVVATFCYQLCNGGEPKVDQDGLLKLIYVDELCDEIISCIRGENNDALKEISATKECHVSEILASLREFKALYLDRGIFPKLSDRFSVQLFNTFRSFIDHGTYFPVAFKQHTDERGAFVELVKLEQGGQVSFSTTVPGITRGNHFHTRKIERFAVIKGKATIQLRRYNTDEVMNFELDGASPAYVDMPVWYTHNIKNTGEEDLYTIFWINEFFDPQDADTYFEVV